MFCRADDPPDPEGPRCLQRHHHQVTKSDRVHEVPDLARVVRDGIRRGVRIGRPQYARQLLAAHPDGRAGQLGPANAHDILGFEPGQVLEFLASPDHPDRHGTYPTPTTQRTTAQDATYYPSISTKSRLCRMIRTHRPAGRGFISRQMEWPRKCRQPEAPALRNLTSRFGACADDCRVAGGRGATLEGDKPRVCGPESASLQIEPAEVILEIDMQPFAARHPGFAGGHLDKPGANSLMP